MNEVLRGIESKLKIMAETVLLDLPSESRKKFEQLITELAHQRDVTIENLLERLRISLSNASFYYGLEYLPLTDRCYLTLTQALNFLMGGNPFGPACTGKTESVKALGAQLGRFVVVMNCDEAFDFGAM
eukprot:scaffold6378_cov22-Cyclotella_meneghiniana.AAC.1